MVAIESLPLTHSWPIYEAVLRLPLGHLLAEVDEPRLPPLPEDPFVAQGIGIWQCDLSDERLSWTPMVYNLFCIPPSERLVRSLVVPLYIGQSRLAMEALRSYAIRHCRGFTLDAQIRRFDGDIRWVRLSALPVMEGRKVVRLCGTKQDVTAEYDGPG